MTDEQLLQRIAIDPKVMLGKPVIKGTRLTVEYVIDRLAHGGDYLTPGETCLLPRGARFRKPPIGVRLPSPFRGACADPVCTDSISPMAS